MRLTSPDTLLRDEGTTDDRVLQLTENHRQQLSELKLRNDRLKDEKASKCNFAWHILSHNDHFSFLLFFLPSNPKQSLHEVSQN